MNLSVLRSNPPSWRDAGALFWGIGPDHERLLGSYAEVTRHYERPASRQPVDVERRFVELADRWRSETTYTSSTTDRVLHPCYQQIIGMGPAVLPVLLRELSRQPDHWFWALRAITGEDPVKPEDRGRVRRMAEAWVRWGKNRGLRF